MVALAALLLSALWARGAGAGAGSAGGASGAGGAGGCGVAEFACRGGGCVRLDAWCDGAAQCADGSDEPAHCSVCNRTYYGRAGVAYALAVRGAARAPFLCHVTLTAGGGAHGDLVQLGFEEFRVGRYEAGAREPCADGFMQLAELGRPFTGGAWCGAAAGGALYYSETNTVTVTVKLFRARLGEPFGFRLRYKFLAQRDAVERYGAREAPLERGAVSPGTYCTRTLEDCHRKPCRLQSPNYPGMYPRNVTCYWSVRQRLVPTCKHAMISVRQDHAHKMHIKRSISMASLNKSRLAVRAWRECTGERDRLIVYDGGSTDDPVLLEYCGGDWLPRVTARGPDMLVAFHSAPYSAPLLPAAPARAPRGDAPAPAAQRAGFELEVDVIFADSDSLDYAREVRRCEFHVKASSSEEEGNATAAGAGRGRRGVLRAPQHTLPPNTTCSWTFHGRPGDLVWIYFSSFTQYSLVEARRGDSAERADEEGHGAAPPPAAPAPAPAAPCAVELRIWDGGGAGAARLVGSYCDAPPALCARASLANATRAPRPCAPPDGYVSSSALLALAAWSRAGTATHPLRFALHYEFVDARLEGAAWVGARAEPVACARLLTVPGEFASPRNALWFGRGGARRLRCVYRLEADGAPLALRLAAAALGDAPRCATRTDPRTGRAACVPAPGAELRAHLVVYEAPWPGVRVPLACVCDNASAPLQLAAAGGALELELVAPELHAREDHRHVHFRGAWTRAPGPARCAARRRLAPPGAALRLAFPYDADDASECGEAPFLLAARGNRSVFLRVWGEELPAAPPPTAGAGAGDAEAPLCHTANRVLVYEAHTSRLVSAVCPSVAPDAAGARSVQLFSAEWGAAGAGAAGAAALLVVWAAREPGSARLAWMEVWRAGAGAAHNTTAGCARACAALGACMDAALWCDGAEQCPGGADEAAGGCGAGARLRALLAAPGAAGAAGAGAALLAALALLGGAAWRRRGARRGKRAHAPRRLTEELLCEAASRSRSRASSAGS